MQSFIVIVDHGFDMDDLRSDICFKISGCPGVKDPTLKMEAVKRSRELSSRENVCIVTKESL